jgi:hypothetical protein
VSFSPYKDTGGPQWRHFLTLNVGSVTLPPSSEKGCAMRPIGVSLIAVLTWIRGALYAAAGLAILGIGHLSAWLVSSVATNSSFQTLLMRVGKVLGVCALLVAVVYVVVGIGLWAMKNWARVLTIVFVSFWFLVGLIGLFRFPATWHIVRAAIEVAIVIYLSLPNVKRLFSPA